MIWIEVLSRHHGVVERHRFAESEMRVGRGYDNDVVLDDPYVAPSHIRICRNERGVLVAEDLGSRNGLFEQRSGQRRQSVMLDDDNPIRIGRTVLRVRTEAHPVAPERVERPRTTLWAVALGLWLAIVAVEIGSLWLRDITAPMAMRYVRSPVGITAVILAWSAAWAVLARIFSGQAQFDRNLVIALAGLLAYSVTDELAGLAGFVLSWTDASVVNVCAAWVALAVTVFCHLRVANVGRPRLAGAIVAGLAGVAILMQALDRGDLGGAGTGRMTRLHLFPPALRVLPAKSESEFFGALDALRADLDRDRAKAVPASQATFDADD